MTKQIITIYIDGVKTPQYKIKIGGLAREIKTVKNLCFLPKMSVMTTLHTNTGKTILLRCENKTLEVIK
ncbi:MAG: hypothetical protein RR839_00610 [Oscillospiraceae bacterium]